MHGSYSDLPNRKLYSETLRKFGYQLADTSNGPAHIAPYHDASGRMVAQKLRSEARWIRQACLVSNSGNRAASAWSSPRGR
jgi:hypothetical protein